MPAWSESPPARKRFGDMMKIGRRGSMTVDLTVRGVQGHVAYPERLDNAVHRLSAHHRGAGARADRQGQHAFPADVAAVHHRRCRQHGDQHRAPGVARARFNTRFNDLWTSKTLLAHLQERIERASASGRRQRHDRVRASRVSGESFYTPPGPLSDLVAGAIRDVAGVEAELSTTGGTSDARFIRSYCPVLEFGLVGESMHKVDEKSAIADLKTLARVYETVLDRYFTA